MVAITFVANCWTLNFFVIGEYGCFHVTELHFVSEVLRYKQVPSPVMRYSRSLLLARWSPQAPHQRFHHLLVDTNAAGFGEISTLWRLCSSDNILGSHLAETLR
ncbi:hypothetical protein PoB_000710100 [Plakobranchus ocellatus]|uniref:Secreted protein n=1 Tax=Plakobranchus ocellatus TaxID=259542 RepID=A0AAV3YBP3_9GAST|nr:hypothetical protein PoB_000710100 [Plakobranchus ocellatus]